jgi:hypothetical protein
MRMISRSLIVLSPLTAFVAATPTTGGKALLELRDRDESGKVEFWIYDDGAKPADPNAHRLGPRWGLAQGDGKLFAAGILYAGQTYYRIGL